MPRKFILKILTAGDGGVGKTTLLHRYVDGVFMTGTHMTIGVEFFLKEIDIDEVDCTLQLWDFGGQAQFRFLLNSYVLGAKGAFVMFDLTRMITLSQIENWVDLCRSDDPDIPMLFLGTKYDLKDKISVDDNYILEVKEKYNFIDFIKVSSKTGENVDKAFELLTKYIIDRYNY